MTVHGIDTLCWSPAADIPPAGWPCGDPGSGHELLRTRDWPLRSYLELRALPTSVRPARRHAAAMLRQWDLEVLTDPVELLASELVTNAVRACVSLVPQVRFWLTSDRRSVLIQVWDSGHCHPVRQDGGDDAEAGRGLLIVESLSACWGCYTPDQQDGKIVWAVCVR